MIVTLAGHVDHGKTALVRALTGVDTDRLEIEKKRGLTIELGFAYAEFDGRRVGFVDVPGHHKFIRNMIAGVSSEQFAMLVVAADEGPMPQTAEHLDILETIGITRGLVVFSRADLASHQRRDETRESTRTLLDGSFLREAETIWCSARSGEGITQVKHALAAAAAQRPPNESSAAHFRLCVDRAFHLSGAGLVITGAVHSGTARIGETLVTSRSSALARVRGIHVADQVAQSAIQGDRAAMNITGIDLDEVKRGDWLLATEARAPTRRLSLKFRAIRRLPRALSRWTSVHVHHGAAHVIGRLRLAQSHVLQAGEDCLVDCLLNEPIVAKWGDPVLIRDAASESTLGGGPVIDTCIGKRSGLGWTRGRNGLLEALAQTDPLDSLRSVLEIRPLVSLPAFAGLRNLPEAALQGKLREAGMRVIDMDGKRQVMLARTLTEARAEILRRVDDWHHANPDADGLPLEAIRRQSNLPTLLLRHAISELVASKETQVQSGALRRPTFASERGPDETALLEALEDRANKTPTLGDLGEALSMNHVALVKAAKRLEKNGDLVFVNERRVVRPKVLEEARAVASKLDAPEGFVVRDFRDSIGLGRNACIDILEYLDRSGATRRIGDRRHLNS